MQLDIEHHAPLVNPGIADIHGVLRRLTPGGDQFAILRSRPSHCFIQTHTSDDGQFAVEYREGGPDRHYEANVPQSLDAVLDAFESYLTGDNRWRTAFEWRRMELPS